MAITAEQIYIRIFFSISENSSFYFISSKRKCKCWRSTIAFTLQSTKFMVWLSFSSWCRRHHHRHFVSSEEYENVSIYNYHDHHRHILPGRKGGGIVGMKWRKRERSRLCVCDLWPRYVRICIWLLFQKHDTLCYIPKLQLWGGNLLEAMQIYI